MNTPHFSAKGNMIRIAPEGDLLHHTYETLEKQLRNRLAPGDEVIVDLEKTDFISSSGIGFLLRLQKITEGLHGKFIVRNPRRHVAYIFTKLRLNTMFALQNDVASHGGPAHVFPFLASRPHNEPDPALMGLS